jgi:hypothetical protein
MNQLRPAYRALAFVLLAGVALAADHQILGRKLLIVEKGSGQRLVVVNGKEYPSAVAYNGDLVNLGASLEVIANGPSPESQTFTLPAAGWSQTGPGAFKYGPTTGADPVRRVRLKLTGTSALLTVVIRGTTGVDVTPPDPGDDGGVVLEVGGGDRYCVSFGGAAGGTESRDDGTRWKIVRATATPGCPVAITTTTSSTTSSTMPLTCGTSGPACDGTCPPGYNCQAAPGMGPCFCVTGGTDGCTICDTPCTSGDVCGSGLDIGDPPNYLITCECVTPPVCGGPMCSGSCPVGFGCTDIDPGPMTSCGCLTF